MLRYLFSNLIDEEIRRDEQYRKAIEKEYQERLGEQLPSLIMPPAFSISDFNPSTPTGKTAGGYMNPLFPQTPGIGLAATPFISTPSCDTDGTNARSSMERHSDDYFSSTPGTTAPNLLIPKNGAATEATAYEEPSGEKEKEEKDSSLFGKWRSFGTKKYRSISVDMNGAKTPVPAADEKSSEEITDKPDPLEEMLGGVVKRIRTRYDTHYQETPEEPIISIINPSLPLETPVLKPPANTEIIVQEDKPDFGGVADLYRGTVGSVGQDASLLESVAPAWLGELILLNHIPVKDTIKVSFVMVPWQDELPVLPSESGWLVPQATIA